MLCLFLRYRGLLCNPGKSLIPPLSAPRVLGSQMYPITPRTKASQFLLCFHEIKFVFTMVFTFRLCFFLIIEAVFHYFKTLLKKVWILFLHGGNFLFFNNVNFAETNNMHIIFSHIDKCFLVIPDMDCLYLCGL